MDRVESEPKKTEGTVLKTALKAIVAIAVSAAALWWALHDVDLDYVTSNLTRISGATLAGYIAIQFAIQVSRIIRWWLLVAPLGKVSLRAVASATNVGLPAAVFLPLRLGELVRPLMIARAGVPLAGGLASVVVERVVDGLFNVGLFFTLVAFLPESAVLSPELKVVAVAMLAGFGGGLVFLTLAYLARARMLGLLERVLSKLSPRFAKRAVDLVSSFLDGLVALGTLPRVLLFLALTVAYWAANGYSIYLLAHGYGLPVPLLAGSFAITCVVFAVTVPAGPAFAGTMEAGFRAGFAPFGVSPSESALVAIVCHVLTLSVLAMYVVVGFQLAESSQRRNN